MSLPEETREFVRQRAGGACEYCSLPEYASVLPHQIDHIIGRQHRGSDDVDNLSGASVNGRLFAQTAVILGGSTVTAP